MYLNLHDVINLWIDASCEHIQLTGKKYLLFTSYLECGMNEQQIPA